MFCKGGVFTKKLDELVVTEVTGVMTVFSPKGRVEEIHNRKYYGLSFCKDGQITYTHNGKEFVSDNRQAIILPKGQSYAIRGDKRGIFPVINFDCLDMLCDTFTVLPINDLDFYFKAYEQIKNLLLFKGNRTKIISIFYDIIHRLYSFDRCDADILFPAMLYLEKHYASPEINNKLLADKCNISEIYFRKLFIKKQGITPRQFIIDTRIVNAIRLQCARGGRISPPPVSSSLKYDSIPASSSLPDEKIRSDSGRRFCMRTPFVFRAKHGCEHTVVW